MCGAPKNRASPVFHQYKIGNVNRQCLAGKQRMLYRQAGVEAPFFGGFHRGFRCAQLGAFGDEISRFLAVFSNGEGKWMVCRNGYERRTKQGIGTGGEYLDSFTRHT